ncbi:ABC-type branched-subunit amino acid transport system substrate-binding protein [Archangium gephyra]|uniref:ABC-type branched-subunit amino acid transport system substrate-binding protein n=1 Tax=Archangium gephyra TaxID=48 RepID=A0AAC8QGQ9_9BACT|nr:ABC transporter substrate-binding protein [Archangium gephyra]AKJ06755.1 cytochrome c, putative [Archangium gephyra]REG31946.1 ABC-type branched-subunit amino acid transport system substrate-binding protein [Archangium gephyra]
MRALPLLLCALSCAAAASPTPLTPREQAGRRIYFEGESPTGGSISATLGANVRLPGSAVPCVNCHGEDGSGRPEGGVLPPDITWTELTKPYGHVHPGGRKHPVLEDRSVARAVSEGIDPGGNRLDAVMPRYSMSWEDMSSLLAWLKRLEHEREPGVTDSALRLGVVLPTRGRLAELGQAMRGVLEAWCAELNASGGIHGRTLELVIAGYDSDQETGLASAQRMLGQEPVFALLSGFLPGAEKELAALAEREALPLIGPFTLSARKDGTPERHVFFLLSDAGEQARVLAEYAARELSREGTRAAILHPEDEGLAGAARAARARLQARGWKQVELLRYTRGAFNPALAEDLKRKGTRVMLFLGNDEELAALLEKARTLGWAPYLLLPGNLSARAAVRAPALFQGRIFLAYPTLPSDEQPRAREAFSRLQASTPAAEGYRMAQVSAYTAATLLTEGLRRSGRQLSRKKLLGHLEGLYAFEPGLVPPLSYGPNRRVGAWGAYVVTVDLAARSFRPVTGWMELPDGG